MRQLVEKSWFRSMQLDRYGHWKPSEIMAAMQEMGGKHAEILGCGREELLKQNAIWVLTRNELHIAKTPRVGDVIVATTFPGKPRRTLFPRYHTFHAEDGTLLAWGAGGWTLADITTHRMVYMPQVLEKMPDTTDLTPPQGYPGAVEVVAGEETRVTRALQYSDFDVNHHVNNTRCADWAQDMLGAQVMEKQAITSLRANYMGEILPGGPVELVMHRSAEAFSLRCSRDGQPLLDVGGTLSPAGDR